MQPTSVFLPGKFHGQRSLAGCSPRDRKESDTTIHRYNFLHCPHLILGFCLKTCCSSKSKYRFCMQPFHESPVLRVSKALWLCLYYSINHVLSHILIMKVVGLINSSDPQMRFMHDTPLNVEYHTISTIFVALN